MAIEVNKVVRSTYSTKYKDGILDLEATVETNPLNITVSTPNNTEMLTPQQVQAQYEYFKDLNSLVQSVHAGKTPRIRSEKTQQVAELIHQD